MQFAGLDEIIVADNPVRIIDVFVENLDVGNPGMTWQ